MGASPTVPKKDTTLPFPVALEDLVDELNTGDIVLFCGNSWYATLIRYFVYTPYSHVGMVHRRVPPGGRTPVLCLWESVGHVDDLYCLLHGRKKSGVRLVSFVDKMREYINGAHSLTTAICVIRVHPRGSAEAASIAARLEAFEDHHCGTAYDMNPLHLARCAYPGLLGANVLTPVNAAFTCNELIAETLVFTRICSEELPVGMITERHFLTGAILHNFEQDAALAQDNLHLTVTHARLLPDAAPPPPPSRRQQLFYDV